MNRLHLCAGRTGGRNTITTPPTCHSAERASRHGGQTDTDSRKKHGGRVHPLRLRVQGKTPHGKPRNTSGDVRHFRVWQANTPLSECQCEYLCYQRRRRCMRVRLMVRDSENPRRFVPMNLSAACITDGYTKKTFDG